MDYILRTLIVSAVASVVFAADPVQLPNGLSITPAAAPHAVEMALNQALRDDQTSRWASR